jgi:hypothetical protein
VWGGGVWREEERIVEDVVREGGRERREGERER